MKRYEVRKRLTNGLYICVSRHYWLWRARMMVRGNPSSNLYVVFHGRSMKELKMVSTMTCRKCGKPIPLDEIKVHQVVCDAMANIVEAMKPVFDSLLEAFQTLARAVQEASVRIEEDRKKKEQDDYNNRRDL